MPGAFGIRSYVEEFTVQLRLLAPRETLRATRERDETGRRRCQEVAPRRLARFDHRRLR
jgi:hypothetical protein